VSPRELEMLLTHVVTLFERAGKGIRADWDRAIAAASDPENAKAVSRAVVDASGRPALDSIAEHVRRLEREPTEVVQERVRHQLVSLVEGAADSSGEPSDEVLAFLSTPDAQMLTDCLLAAKAFRAATSDENVRSLIDNVASLRFGAPVRGCAKMLHALIAHVAGAPPVGQGVSMVVRPWDEDEQLRYLKMNFAAQTLRDTAMRRVRHLSDLASQARRVELKKSSSTRTAVEDLRKAISTVHGMLTPPSVDRVVKVPFDELYLAPMLSLNRPLDGEVASSDELTPSLVAAHELGERRPRAVVLGDPGAGKSTLIAYLAKRGCGAESQEGVALPLILREQAPAEIQSFGLDILSALQDACLKKYQVDIEIPQLRWLCTTGRITVLIDGLDELLVLAHRSSVTQAIEAFATIYAECPMVVTSRSVGYHQAPLSRSTFPIAFIAPMGGEAVGQYARRWFRCVMDHPTTQQVDDLVEHFLQESSGVSELRQNPLLLSLMCGLYKHQNYIPRNRPAVYAACARLLFDTWDRRRQLRPSFDWDAHVDGAVQHLAYWIFRDQGRHAGVPEHELLAVAADYFSEWQYQSPAEGMRAAGEFLEFCKGRAWILTDTGTQSDVALYQFTHRTFMEYFTAVHLTRLHGEQELLGIVVSKAPDPSWNMVCQLILQLMPSKRHGLEDQSIEALVRLLPKLDVEERRIAMSVATAALRALPLRPSSSESIADIVLKHFVARLERVPIQGGVAIRPLSQRDDLWLDGSQVAAENHRAVARVVVKRLNELGVRGRSQLAVAVPHLIDFLLVPGVVPSDLKQAMHAENTSRLGELTGETTAWLDICALLLSVARPFPVLPSWETLGLHDSLVGENELRVLGPAQLPWGNRLVPNCLEALVWRGVHVRSEEESGLLGVDARVWGSQVLARLATDGPPWTYQPHWLWEELGRGAPHPSVSVFAPEDERMVLICALTLVELYLAGDLTDAERTARLRRLLTRTWGALQTVPTMVAQKYNLDKPRQVAGIVSSPATLQLTSWSEDSDVRAVDLLHIVRPGS
jgi:hypothetical protein